MFPWNLMVKDANGYFVTPRWLVVALPVLTAGAAWGGTWATLESRVATLEVHARRHEAVLERLIRIETILEEIRKEKR